MRLVIALGGNALLRRGEAMTAENQRDNVRIACEQIAKIATGNELVVAHGNGLFEAGHIAGFAGQEWAFGTLPDGATVRVRATNREGQTYEFDAEGLLAVCVQLARFLPLYTVTAQRFCTLLFLHVRYLCFFVRRTQFSTSRSMARASSPW